MNPSTRTTTTDTAQNDVAVGVFVAVLVTEDRLHVLRELTHQAVAHFGRDHLYIRDLNVVPTNAGASWLATADFSLSPLTPSQL